MSRSAFLASLRPGTAVHYVFDVGGDSERHTDAEVVAVSKGRTKITVRLPNGEVVLDGDGYRPRSTSVRIQPADGSAAEWNRAAIERGQAYTKRLRERAAAHALPAANRPFTNPRKRRNPAAEASYNYSRRDWILRGDSSKSTPDVWAVRNKGGAFYTLSRPDVQISPAEWNRAMREWDKARR